MYNKHFATNLFLGKYYMTFIGSYKWNSTINTVSPQTDRQKDGQKNRETDTHRYNDTINLRFLCQQFSMFLVHFTNFFYRLWLDTQWLLGISQEIWYVIEICLMECLRALSSASWSRCRWSSIEDFTGSVDTVIQSTLMVLCTRRDHY